MEKFRISAKLVSITIGGNNFASDEKSGCRFKMVATLDEVDMDQPEGVGKAIGHTMAGEIDLTMDKTTMRLDLCACTPEFEFEKERLVVKCEAKKAFSDQEILFLKNNQGHELIADFNPSQRVMEFDGDEDEEDDGEPRKGDGDAEEFDGRKPRSIKSA